MPDLPRTIRSGADKRGSPSRSALASRREISPADSLSGLGPPPPESSPTNYQTSLSCKKVGGSRVRARPWKWSNHAGLRKMSCAACVCVRILVISLLGGLAC